MKIFIWVLIFVLNSAYAMTYEEASLAFEKLTEASLHKIKEGSRPFMLGQGHKTKTVVMFHGLSDSPGSLQEIAQVYYGQGYNVVTILLRDHGLKNEYRYEARKNITLSDWRQDVDALIKIGFELSDTKQVALAGYSLGGALAIDTAHRYEGRISSIAMVTPMFKMMYAFMTPLTQFLKYIVYSTKKGITETEYFYSDIALNQTFYASKLARQLKRKVTRRPTKALKDIPKIIFLTDADTTIKNKYVMKVAKKIKATTIMYKNENKDLKVLHRDLPMRRINANNMLNPHLDPLLKSLDLFLSQLR